MKRELMIAVLCCTAGVGCAGAEPEDGATGELDQVEQAATGTYALAQYMIPSCAGAAQAYATTPPGGGVRQFVPMGIAPCGRGRFVYMTSASGADFLEFTVDASWIRLWADTSWAHNNHPPAPECSPSDYCDEVSGPTGAPTTTCRCLWFHGTGSADYVYNAPLVNTTRRWASAGCHGTSR